MIDPDEFFTEKREDHKALDHLLADLQDCALSEWDQDFVDDMTDKVAKYKEHVKVSALQWDQLDRMKRQYGVG